MLPLRKKMKKRGKEKDMGYFWCFFRMTAKRIIVPTNGIRSVENSGISWVQSTDTLSIFQLHAQVPPSA
jgi:hypothetical protein